MLDVAWLCISRFILLDSMLLFFTLLTVFCLTKFHNQRHQCVLSPFARRALDQYLLQIFLFRLVDVAHIHWWSDWLYMQRQTHWSFRHRSRWMLHYRGPLGQVRRCPDVSCEYRGIYKFPSSVNKIFQRDQARHWIARVGCLIVLPFVVYMVTFKIHFLILNHSGPGDAQMSSLFQANLVGNDFKNNPLGARILA